MITSGYNLDTDRDHARYRAGILGSEQNVHHLGEKITHHSNQGTECSSAAIVVAEEVDSKKAEFVIKRLIKLQSASHLTQFLFLLKTNTNTRNPTASAPPFLVTQENN